MFAGGRCAKIAGEGTPPSPRSCLRLQPEVRSYLSLRFQPRQQRSRLQRAFGCVLVLDIGENISLHGPVCELLFDLLQLSRPVVAFAQPVAAEWGGDYVRCLQFVALRYAKRGLMLSQQVEDLAGKPRSVAKFKGDAQCGRALRRDFF